MTPERTVRDRGDTEGSPSSDSSHDVQNYTHDQGVLVPLPSADSCSLSVAASDCAWSVSTASAYKHNTDLDLIEPDEFRAQPPGQPEGGTGSGFVHACPVTVAQLLLMNCPIDTTNVPDERPDPVEGLEVDLMEALSHPCPQDGTGRPHSQDVFLFDLYHVYGHQI
eukprot:4918320-Amphidinium_carterae.1